MSFWSRHMQKSRPRTALEEFGDNLTTRAIPAVMRNEGTRDERIAWGLATMVLVTARDFAVGLQEHVADIPGPKRNYRLPFDDIMIEAAAFCHYLLSRDHPPTDEDLDDVVDEDLLDTDELDSPLDGLGADACASALFTSQAIVSKHLPPGHSQDFLERRWLFYTAKLLPRDDRALAEFFGSVVLAIIDEKMPDPSAIRGLGPGLQLTLASGTFVPIFYQTQIAALRQMARSLFENADALLRELDE